MTGPHTNKDYSAADIERYHKGMMTPKEAHELERAALDDPFLSDALDGYVDTQTPVADADALKQRLRKRYNRNRILYLNPSKAPLRVAAMVLLLATGGWLLYQWGNNTRDVAMDTVVKRETVSPERQTQTQPAAADTPTLQSGQDSVGILLQNADNAIAKKEKPAAKPISEPQSAPAAANDAYTFGADTLAAAVMADAVGETASRRALVQTFRGRVVDAANNAMPHATVTIKDRSASTITDAGGNFSISLPDSSVEVVVSYFGFAPEKALLQSDSDLQNTIVLQRRDAVQSEVVVTSKGKVAQQNKVRLEAVEPLEGWEGFNNYVDQNVLSTEQKPKIKKDGEVALSFDVDRNGNAVNIAVEKPLCSSCDSTAVRIIQQGSKWKKKSSKRRARAFIRF